MSTKMKFINRTKELKILDEQYLDGNSNFFILYGKRRLGKTQLLIKFMEKYGGIYFLCSKEGDNSNLKAIQEEFSNFFKDSLYESLNIENNWVKFFEILVKMPSFVEYTKRQKLILIFDEFPYLIEKNSAIPSIFQKIWDLYLQKQNVMLILLGSSQSVIENKVLAYKSPLYGRRTASYHLTEMEFKHFKEFLPKFSFENLIKTYYIIGGVTQYLKLFDSDKSFFENIKVHFLEKTSFLLNEADFLLNEEFRETKNYKIILKAISSGKNTSGEITNETGLDKSLVSRYIEILRDLYIIKEQKPLLSKPLTKKTKYFISDNYFDFWFKYIYPNKNKIESEEINYLLDLIKMDFSRFSGKKFESFVLNNFYLFSKNFVKYDEVNSQWGSYTLTEDKKKVTKTYEIDICGINESNKEILFGECKWQDNVDAQKVLDELKEKTKHVKWNLEDRKEEYVIFARSFKQKRIDGAKLYNLKDIEKLFK